MKHSASIIAAIIPILTLLCHGDNSMVFDRKWGSFAIPQDVIFRENKGRPVQDKTGYYSCALYVFMEFNCANCILSRKQIIEIKNTCELYGIHFNVIVSKGFMSDVLFFFDGALKDVSLILDFDDMFSSINGLQTFRKPFLVFVEGNSKISMIWELQANEKLENRFHRLLKHTSSTFSCFKIENILSYIIS